MRRNNCTRPQQRLFPSLLRQLLEAKRPYHTQLVPSITWKKASTAGVSLQSSLLCTLALGSGRSKSTRATQTKQLFASPHVLATFFRLPFGLKKAVGTFQKSLEVIPSSARRQGTVVYMHDNVVLSKWTLEHIEKLRRVLQIHYKTGVMLKLRKWKVFAKTNEYSGYVVRAGCLDLAERKTDIFRKIGVPQQTDGATLLLRLENVYRWFLPSFAPFSDPPRRYLRRV